MWNSDNSAIYISDSSFIISFFLKLVHYIANSKQYTVHSPYMFAGNRIKVKSDGMKYILLKVHSETFLCKRKLPNLSLRKVTMFTNLKSVNFNTTVKL